MEHPPVLDFATDFDHTDEAWVADPYSIMEDLRDRCPVAHSERYGGMWAPMTHATVSAIANDTEHFTSRTIIITEGRPTDEAPPAPIGVAPPISSDPPFHELARRLLLPAFAPRPVNALEGFSRELCNQLLDDMGDADVINASVQYTQHIPVGLIAKMVGLPPEDGDLFRSFVHEIIEAVDLPVAEADRVLGKAVEHEYNLFDLLRRPGVGLADLMGLNEGRYASPDVSRETLGDDFAAVSEQVEIAAKYAGYIGRQIEEVERSSHYEQLKLPAELDYMQVSALSIEARQKLAKHRPETLGLASRISGITPASISLLLIHLKKGGVKGFKLAAPADVALEADAVQEGSA